jgi:hypothetical protein
MLFVDSLRDLYYGKPNKYLECLQSLTKYFKDLNSIEE